MDAESKSRGGRWRGASSAAALAVVGALCGAAAWWCAPRLSGAGVVEWGASVAAAEGRYEGSTEAERLVQQGRALEEEAAALKANRPKDAEARYRQAKGVYREAIKADADFVEGYVRLGYAHYALQENAEAEAMLRPLLARWPDSAELRRVYGTVTFSLEGKRAEAVRHLEVAGAREDWFDVQFLLGKHYYETGKLDEAAKAFRLYLAQKPKDIEVHGTLGNIYLKTRKYEPALAEFRYVLSLSPGNVPARINIASIAFRQGKFPEAIRVFEEVLRDSPDQTGVHFNLASSYYQSDDYANALKHYQAFGASRPKHAATRYMSALCLLELGREGEAVAALESTLKVDPKHAKAHWRLGRLALGKGQVKEAKARFERARESDPKLAWPLIDLGRIEREAGRLEEAVRLHAEAVKLEPESAPARDALGRDHFAAGRLEAALAAWREAYALASKGKPKARAKAARVLSVGLLHQGGALLAGGDREGARRCGDEVVGLKEEVAGGRLLLLAVALASGDAKGAEAQLAEAAKASPEHPYVRYGQGRAALERGAYEEALGRLQAAVAGSKGGEALNAGVANDMGRALAGLGRWEEALEWFGKARARGGVGVEASAVERNIALASLRWSEVLGEADRWKKAEEALGVAQELRGRLSEVEQIRLDLALGSALTENGSYGKAQKHLGDAARALGQLKADQRAQLPKDDALGLGVRLAYVHYRLGQTDLALGQIERASRKQLQRGDVGRMVAHAYVKRAAEQFRAGNVGQAEATLRKAQKTQLGRTDEAVQHNLAVVDYVRGKQGKAGPVFQGLGGIPEALFNYAIFLDDVKGDKEGAFQYYGRYLQRGGPRAGEAQREVAIKKRVFGFGGGGGGGQ